MTDEQPDRRKDDPRVQQVIENQVAIKAQVTQLSTEVATNTALTKQIQESTAGLVAFFQESRGAFRLFNRIMNGLHWFIRKALFHEKI